MFSLLRILTFVTLSIFISSSASATTITNDPDQIKSNTYDFVIAGGGLTAIVVGNKLSEKGYTVLLIESGKNLPDHPPIYNIERRGELNEDPETDCNWHYTASAEDGSDLAVKIDSGKCIGGSTSINGAVWFRPAPTEVNAIGALGNEGWSYNSLLPYFVAEERNILPTDLQRVQGANVNPDFHGYEGLVNTSFPTPMRIPSAVALYKGAMSSVFGLAVSDDLSARDGAALASTSWSIWYDEASQINRRSSAAYAYLYPESQQRETLTVLTEHTVGRVLFDWRKKATGIEFGHSGGGPLYQVQASREVLLAAGSLGSPAILERSGVGNKRLLHGLGISTVVDLPAVGLNLQDQPGTGLSGLVFDQYMSNNSLIDNRNIFAPVIGLANIDQVFGDRASDVISSLQDSRNLRARVRAAVAAGTMASVQAAYTIFSAAIELMTESKMPIAEIVGESYPSVMTSIFWPLTPLSRGHIHISSSDPFAPPRITPRFLTDDFDVDVAVEIAKKGRALFTSSSFSDIVADPVADGPPADATDEEYAQWYKESSFGASHWTGSCSMLPQDKGGVVSPQLKVYGTSNLRVVDASILPLQITSHTQPMAYAIAQKAADMILQDCH